jgi:hypothetical protein
VVGRNAENDAPRRLSDLRRAQTDDPTLKNLLAILTVKLELCSRLPVCEWEAAHEDDMKCAATFRQLAEEERRSCSYVLDCLQKHLERRAMIAGGSKA